MYLYNEIWIVYTLNKGSLLENQNDYKGFYVFSILGFNLNLFFILTNQIFKFDFNFKHSKIEISKYGSSVIS